MGATGRLVDDTIDEAQLLQAWRRDAERLRGLGERSEVLGLAVPGIEVVDVATTGKTLPDFVALWQSMLDQGSRAA